MGRVCYEYAQIRNHTFSLVEPLIKFNDLYNK